jgi:hypothetical protein
MMEHAHAQLSTANLRLAAPESLFTLTQCMQDTYPARANQNNVSTSEVVYLA